MQNFTGYSQTKPILVRTNFSKDAFLINNFLYCSLLFGTKNFIGLKGFDYISKISNFKLLNILIALI